MKKNNLQLASIGIFISLTLFIFLSKFTSFQEILELIKEMNKIFFILGFLSFLFTYFLRSIRFKLFCNNLSFWSSFYLVSLHNFFNSVLPARLGELSYPYILNKKLKTGFVGPISDLILMRFFDFLSIGLLLSISFIFMFNIKHKVAISFFLFMMWFFIFISILSFSKALFKKIKKANVSDNLRGKILGIIIRLLDRINSHSKTSLFKFLLISSMISLSMMFTTFFLVSSLGVKISIGWIIFGGGLTVISGVLPIQGFFNVGLFEASLSLPLILAGLDKSLAISTSFGYHMLVLIFTLIMFLISSILDYLKRKIFT